MSAIRLRAVSWRSIFGGSLTLLLASPIGATETGSPQYRLVGPAPASTATRTASPMQQLRWIGGSGQAVGIAASANASAVSGGASQQLPTNRIFRNGLED